jgi:hypothetical protein
MFEENNIQPEVGGYIIVNNRLKNNTFKINDFLKNKIGKIIDINKTMTPNLFTIDYGFDSEKKIPTKGLLDFFFRTHINDTDINYCFKCQLTDNEFIFAKTKKELDIKIKTNKYNI